MELTWPIKLRIGLAAAVGIALIGVLGWPLVAPVEPFGVVSIVSGAISNSDTIVLIVLGFVSGFVSYFFCWPMGSQIGVFAAPAGLAYLAAKSGDMGKLFQLNPTVTQREELLSRMRWEALLWLAVVGAGFLGVLLASRITHSADYGNESASKPVKRDALYFVNPALAVLGSVVVSQFFIGIFARDFSVTDAGVNTAVGQPVLAQIVLALLVSFGIAGFLVKEVLNLGYVPVIISTCLVSPFAIMFYGRQDVMAYFANNWPAVFFPHATLAVLPIQMVSYGTIGAIAGYWIGIRIDYWHKFGL